MSIARSIVRSIVGGIVGSIAGAIASLVRDIFFSLNTDSTYSGPDTITTDYLGVLQVGKSPYGQVEGGRFADTIANGAALSADLKTTPATSVSAPWVHVGASVYSIDGSQAGATNVYDQIVTVGVRYQVKITVSDYGGGVLSLYIGGSAVTLTASANGDYVAEAISDGTRVYLQADADLSGTVYYESTQQVIPLWQDTAADLTTSLQPYTVVNGVKQWIYHDPAIRAEVLTLGEFRSAISSDDTERYYEVTTAGTTHATVAPTFPTSGTVVDGTVTYTYAGYHTIKGYVNEEARTNKLTSMKAVPTVTTGLTIGGGGTTPATLTVVDPSTEGIDVPPGFIGNVYKQDNSAGDAISSVRSVAQVGNINLHSAQALILSDGGGLLGLNGSAPKAIVATSGWELISAEGITPPAVDNVWFLQANVGVIIYFILPQLEEAAFSTSPIAFDSNGDDVLAAITRPATNLTRSATAFPVNKFLFTWRVEAEGAGQTGFIAGFDAATITGISTTATTVIFQKDGVDLPITFTHQAGVGFEGQAILDSDVGMSIAIKEDGGVWSAWTEDLTANGKLDASIGSDWQVGANNNAGHFNGHIPNSSVTDVSNVPGGNPKTYAEDKR